MVGWRFRIGDALRAAEDELELRARAGASLYPSTQKPRSGGRAR